MNSRSSDDDLLNDLVRSLDAATRASTFDCGSRGIIDAREYALGTKRLTWNSPLVTVLLLAKLRTHEQPLSDLVGSLEFMLAPFLQPKTKRLGNGLFSLLGGLSSMACPTVPEFARMLVKGAAQLGSAHVSELLLGWLQGDPLCHRRSYLLEGIRIDQPIEIEDGIHLYKLPHATELFPLQFPDLSLLDPKFEAQQFFGAVYLSIECYMFPALFAPAEGEERSLGSGHRISHANASTILPAFSVSRFCKALSQRKNCNVSSSFDWNDHGELRAFADIWGTSWRGDAERRFANGILFAKRDVRAAVESIYPRTGKLDSQARIDLAMNRWIRARRTTSILDSLIELRIAFEALYDVGGSTEKSFRVATHAAWHVAENAEERRRYFNVVKSVYAEASKVIHASRPKKALDNPVLISSALDICRKGIIKLSEKGQPEDWGKLILGAS